MMIPTNTPYVSDRMLHLLPGWASHTQADGSQIGGVPPVSYGMAVGLPGFPTSALFWCAGSSVAGGYADIEDYIKRPLFPNTGNCILSVAFAVDRNYAEFAQALELDTIYSRGGHKWNGSLQINHAEGDMVQIAKADGGWVDTGIKLNLAADVAHTLAVQYRFDEPKLTCSVVAVNFDSESYPVPSNLQGVAAAPTTWGDGVFFQVQRDLNALAGRFSVRVDDAQYDWW